MVTRNERTGSPELCLCFCVRLSLSFCLHVHLKTVLTQVWLPSLSFFSLSEFFFSSHSPLSSRPAHWRKRTRDDSHCLFFTILFMSHNSSLYLSVLSVRQNTHSPSFTPAFTWAPALSTDLHYQASSSITDQMYGDMSLDSSQPFKKIN